MVKRILILFLSWKVFALLCAYVATFLLPLQDVFTPIRWDISAKKLPYLVWIWGNFDGIHYLEIARNGYHILEQAFFPFFPFVIRVVYEPVSRLIPSPYLVAGLLVSHIAFFLSLIVSYKLLTIDGKNKLTSLFFLIVILFPMSFFYGAVYNDSLFLLLATLTLYFTRKKLWVHASFTAALATLTRLNGLALIFPIIIEYVFSKHKTGQSQLTEKIYAVALIPAAFIGYLLYVHVQFGDWYLVFSSMKAWGQDKVIFPLQTVWRYLKIIIINEPSTITYWVAVLELSFVILYVFLMVYSIKKIRFSYWVFFLASILIPSLTGTFQGMPRYGLHLYPFFLALTLFLEKRGKLFKIIYFTLSVAILFFALTLFTRGYFIA